MSSLEKSITNLESDILSDPPRISVYHDLPFAIFRYDTNEEWDLRRAVDKLATRLKNNGKNVKIISLIDLLWECIEKSEGLDVLVDYEKEFGFNDAQEQVNVYLTNEDYCPLKKLLIEKINRLDPNNDVVFVVHAISMAPSIYHLSTLLNEMHGKTQVTIILFYPGSREGTTGLIFMDVPGREASANYRVKIYN